MRGRDPLRFDGMIVGASFSSGDTIVAGCWWASPFGAFADVMWARADGTRVLVGPEGPELDFVWSHYWFDEWELRVHDHLALWLAAATGEVVRWSSLTPRCWRALRTARGSTWSASRNSIRA